jgi:hypothetical protein
MPQLQKANTQLKQKIESDGKEAVSIETLSDEKTYVEMVCSVYDIDSVSYNSIYYIFFFLLVNLALHSFSNIPTCVLLLLLLLLLLTCICLIFLDHVIVGLNSSHLISSHFISSHLITSHLM